MEEVSAPGVDDDDGDGERPADNGPGSGAPGTTTSKAAARAETANAAAAARALQDDATCEVTLLGKGPGGPKSVVYCYDGGIVDFVKHINKHKEAIHPRVIHFEGEGEIFDPQSGQTKHHSVEVAMQWNAGYNDNVFSFANNINTHEGGTHLSGFRSALTRTINDYARSKGFLKEKEENLSGEDVREGLAAIVSVKLQDPQYEGQTKTKLGNSEIRGFVEGMVNQKLAEFLEENPSRRQADHQQDGAGGARPHGGPQGPGPHPPQEHPREHHAARQAGRLLHPRPRVVRALPGRGRLGRRLRETGSGP